MNVVLKSEKKLILTLEGENMKILNVLAQLPMKTGSGVYFSSLIEELSDLGHENILLYGVQEPYSVELPGTNYEVRFNTEELPFPIAGMSDVMPYKSTVYSEMTDEMIDRELKAFKEKLLEIKKKHNIDLVISHHLFFLTSLTREIFDDVPVVAFCHGTDLRQIERYPKFLKRLEGIKNLDRIFTVSPNEKNTIASIFNFKEEKIILVGGGFNQKIFNRDYKKEPSDILRVCYAGKLSRAKGVYELASTFPLVKEKFENLEYHIIGATSKEEKEKLKSLAGFKEGFMVYDAEDQKKMAEHLKKCHVFVLPSYYEALGLIAIEAMATGLYAVTSEIEGLRTELGEKVNKSGVILYTKLPRIYDFDRPCEEDIEGYVKRLSENIIVQLEKVKSKIGFEEEIIDIIEEKSWQKLAKRIECYLKELI